MIRVASMMGALVLGLGLSSCFGGGATPEQRAEAECAAQGGKMQRVGRMQSLQCVLQYADAGKTCRNASDCQGDCRVPGSVIVSDGRAVDGQCTADSSPFGCYTPVKNGRATAPICVD
ncbi:MAG: hypothetical protein Q8S53_07580 [Brevundimonas sp.]|uniref:hypothetical protein n=1 Tax=Brevundimonas sp. TaxID=1871086 RepID=UPI0027354EA9|nr:hypothetical protein [Brevundimonas sp.]MDP3378212.1 hypothetical protein [Brevundimonas sp.]